MERPYLYGLHILDNFLEVRSVHDVVDWSGQLAQFLGPIGDLVELAQVLDVVNRTH